MNQRVPIVATLGRLAPLATAIPYFLLVGTLIRTWIAPLSVDDGTWVPLAVGLMGLEFVVLHSGGFMGALAVGNVPPRRKLLIFLGMVALYALFALGFSLAAGGWRIMRIYGLLMAGRLLTVMAASREGKILLLMRSGVGVAAYLGSVFLTLFIPLPSGGITPSILNQVYPDRGSGAWETNPEIAIAAGILYFTIMGLFELYLAGPGGRKAAGRVSGVEGNPFVEKPGKQG